jgi:hypothetical protein
VSTAALKQMCSRSLRALCCRFAGVSVFHESSSAGVQGFCDCFGRLPRLSTMNVLDYLTCPMAIDIEAAHQQWHALGPMAVPVPLQLAQVAFPLMGGNTQLVPLKALCFFNCDPVDYLD